MNLAVQHLRGTNGNNEKISATRIDSADSRIMFYGVEDLGGGMRSSFLLANAFRADTGAGGICNVECWLELKTDGGTIRLGHLLPIYDDVSVPWYFLSIPGNHNPAALWANCGKGAGLVEGCLDNYLSKAIRYNSPVFGGWSGSFTVSDPSQDLTGAARHARIAVAGIEYKKDAWYLGLAHQRQRDVRAAGLNDNGSTFSLSYRGAVSLGLGLEHLRYSMADGSSLTRNYLGILLSYQAGAHTIWGNYGVASRGRGSSASGSMVNAIVNTPASGANMASLGYLYAFSSSTAIYAYYNILANQANGLYAFDASLGSQLGRGENLSSLAIGIRKRF